MFFNMNGTGRGRPNISIVELYENIIIQQGIHYPMTKKSFKVLYERYKKLGGKIDFSNLEQGLIQNAE